MINLLDKIKSKRSNKKIVNRLKNKDKIFSAKLNLPNNKKKEFK